MIQAPTRRKGASSRRRGCRSGFTLIELLVVIVVLGILAATVVFALTGVTGQSAQAACNSDAKTIDVAVQAYINSPDNATNAPPANIKALITAPFDNPVTGQPDTFLADAADQLGLRDHADAVANPPKVLVACQRQARREPYDSDHQPLQRLLVRSRDGQYTL